MYFGFDKTCSIAVVSSDIHNCAVPTRHWHYGSGRGLMVVWELLHGPVNMHSRGTQLKPGHSWRSLWQSQVTLYYNTNPLDDHRSNNPRVTNPNGMESSNAL